MARVIPDKPDMKYLKLGILVFLIATYCNACTDMNQIKKESKSEDMMIRIAEIEIDSACLDEYISILKEESEASVRLEPGVICIYPMFQKEYPAQIRLLEIYASEEAYESHLQTPHFQHYKTTTLDMVKSLRLIEMEAIDEESMPRIFKKLDP